MSTTYNDAVVFNGTVALNGSISAAAGVLSKSNLTERSGIEIPINLFDARVWNSGATLPSTAANDDLGFDMGTFGTHHGKVSTGDVKASSGTRYCLWHVPLPECYVAAGDITLRASAGMVTTEADSSCTLDFEVYKIDGDNTVTGDLCSTAVKDINQTANTFANYDFTITATDRDVGDVLEIRAAIAYVDSATGTAVIGTIAKLSLLLDIK